MLWEGNCTTTYNFSKRCKHNCKSGKRCKHEHISESQLHNHSYQLSQLLLKCWYFQFIVFKFSIWWNSPSAFIECQRISNSDCWLQSGRHHFSWYSTKTGNNLSTIWANYIKHLKRLKIYSKLRAIFNSYPIINYGIPSGTNFLSEILTTMHRAIIPANSRSTLLKNKFFNRTVVKQRTQLNANYASLQSQQLSKLLLVATLAQIFYPRQHLGGRIWYVVALWRPSKTDYCMPITAKRTLIRCSSDKQFANSEYSWPKRYKFNLKLFVRVCIFTLPLHALQYC